MRSNNIKEFFWGGLLCTCLNGCSKLVDVSEPVNTITTTETFISDGTASSAVMGIYADITKGLSYGSGLITMNAGMSADELHNFNGPTLFETNTLDAKSFPIVDLWYNPYYDIYMANAVIDGLAASSGVSSKTRQQLTGEAKFLRAFCYFYLVNLYGDVPLVLTNAYAKTDTASRRPVSVVYQQIISDLQDASTLLPNDYSISNGEKIRVNQAGAGALLARVYLYQQKWQQAETTAGNVIGSGLFSLPTDLNQVFLANSPEAILQWQIQSNAYPYATQEGNTFIPPSNTDPSNYYFTDQLLTGFEPGDKRKDAWVGQTNLSGTDYYYPFKYQVRVGAFGNVAEYQMVLRLAEQYLIRAEARAQQDNLTDAISDLNEIRDRAGLSPLPSSLTKSEVLSAVMQERRIELMAEWGNRWLDLKRTGQADSVLSLIKPTWRPSAKLYPIPASELINDANLIQNPGY